MKLTLLMLFICFLTQAQEPSGAIEAPELNILYRGYPNILIPAVTNSDGREIKLIGSTNVEITERQNSTGYIVKPGIGKTACLHVCLVNGKSIDTVHSMTYRLLNMPTPTLYWGDAKDGTKANIRSSKIFAKYPPSVPLNAYFVIKTWEFQYKGETVYGAGSSLKSAEEFLMKIEEETEIQIVTTVVGPDGIQRKVKAQWIIQPWNETKPELIEIECGG